MSQEGSDEAQTGPPLLTYGFGFTPDPLQAGGSVRLGLTVSNGTGEAITCSQIVVYIPLGVNAKDLAPAGAAISVKPGGDWTCQASGGSLLFVPPVGGGTIRGEGLFFEIVTTANAQPGTTGVTVTETASTRGMPSAARTIEGRVTKFPPDFSLSELLPLPRERTQVASGQTVDLTWNATGTGVSCVLEYQPADQSDPISQNVANDTLDRPFVSQPLTRSSAVTFTLTAQVPVLGQDEPLVAQRQLVIDVATLALRIYAEPPAVGMNGLARLRWSATNADHCLYQDGTRLPASGMKYLLLQRTQVFTVTAVGSDGETILEQVTIEVNPAIVATAPGETVNGAQGADGTDQQLVRGRGHSTEGPTWEIQPSTPGAPGGDALFSRPMPRLETSGASVPVIPIALTGGTGGKGGRGMNHDSRSDSPAGRGGNAVLTLDWDPNATSTAHYLITLAAGPGGTEPIAAGPGTASATVDGEALALP